MSRAPSYISCSDDFESIKLSTMLGANDVFCTSEVPITATIERFCYLLSQFVSSVGRESSSSLQCADHFLFWNDFSTESDHDGSRNEIPNAARSANNYLEQTLSCLQKDGYHGRHAPPDHLWQHRLWNSGKVIRKAPILLNKPARCYETIKSIEIVDAGRSRVTTWRHIFQDATLKLVEQRCLLYTNQNATSRVARESRVNLGKVILEYTPSDVCLFRYSALTSNAHRIHYDRSYTRHVENYPDILVHGSLNVSVALYSCAISDDRIIAYTYQMLSPCLVDETLQIRLRSGTLVSRVCIVGKHSQELKLVLTIQHDE